MESRIERAARITEIALIRLTEARDAYSKSFISRIYRVARCQHLLEMELAAEGDQS